MTPLFALLAAAAVLVASSSSVDAAPQQSPVGNLGNGNINPLLNDANLVRKQLGCLKGTSNCDRLGKQLMAAVREVINNRCSRCTPTQRRNARKLVDFVQTNHPADYNIILARFMG